MRRVMTRGERGIVCPASLQGMRESKSGDGVSGDQEKCSRTNHMPSQVNSASMMSQSGQLQVVGRYRAWMRWKLTCFLPSYSWD